MGMNFIRCLLPLAILASAGTTVRGADEPAYRPIATFDLQAFETVDPYRCKTTHSLQYSPDGKYLVCGWMLIHTPTLTNWGAFKEGAFSMGKRYHASFTPDSRCLILHGGDISAWELPSADLAKRMAPPGMPRDLLDHASRKLPQLELHRDLVGNEEIALFPNGGERIITLRRHAIALRDTATGAVVAEADAGIESGIPLVCLSGKKVLIWKRNDSDAPLMLWDMKSVGAEKLPGSNKRNGKSRGISLTKDGTLLVEAVYNYQDAPGELRIWDLEKGVKRSIAMPVPPCSVACLQGGNKVVVGLAGGAVELFDLATGRKEAELLPAVNPKWEGANILGIAVSPDGRQLALRTAHAIKILGKDPIPEAKAAGSDFFPAKQGSTWIYKRKDGENHIKVDCDGTFIVGNTSMTKMFFHHRMKSDGPLIEYHPGAFRESYFVVDKSGINVFKEINYGYETRTYEFSPFLTQARVDLHEGDKWDIRSDSRCMQYAHLSYSIEARYQTRGETIKVPAGSFDAVVSETAAFKEFKGGSEVRSSSLQKWYAKGVGLVKWADGPNDIYELVKYRPAAEAMEDRFRVGTVWHGECDSKVVGKLPAKFFLTERSGDRFKGELHLFFSNGELGKATCSGTISGTTATWSTQVVSGRRILPASYSGKIEGTKISGNWNAGQLGGTGTFSWNLAY